MVAAVVLSSRRAFLLFPLCIMFVIASRVVLYSSINIIWQLSICFNSSPNCLISESRWLLGSPMIAHSIDSSLISFFIKSNFWGVLEIVVSGEASSPSEQASPILFLP